MPLSTISYLWRDRKATEGFQTGVSLHSHTNQSHETLDFLANLGNQYSMDSPAADAPGAALRADARRADQLRGQLLDAADDPEAGLRPGDRGRLKS
jgi:hypothetical protein